MSPWSKEMVDENQKLHDEFGRRCDIGAEA
jgi:hypothetical protein